MTTKHDSMDASPHGFFVESPHGMRNDNGRVLVWLANSWGAVVAGRAYAQQHYGWLSAALECDDDRSWTGNILDYTVIFLVQPIRDAPWQSTLAMWSGRIHTCATATTSEGIVAYSNLLIRGTGMVLHVDNEVPIGLQEGIVLDHPLTQGVTRFLHGGSSGIVGGSPMVQWAGRPGTFIVAEARAKNIQWVAVGGVDHIDGAVHPAIRTANLPFFKAIAS